MKPRPEEREKLAVNSWKRENWYAIEEMYTEQIEHYDRGRKYLICSEMEILRWRGSLRNRMIDAVKAIFTTCDYQETLLKKTFGVGSVRLPEPINPYLYYPCEKREKSIFKQSG